MNKPSFKATFEDTVRAHTLRDILAPLFRHWRLAICVFVGVFLLSVLVAWKLVSNFYVATMQIVVEQDRSDPSISSAQNAAVMNNKTISPDIVSSEVALLKGQDMLRSVADTCSLANKKPLWDILLPQDPIRRKAAILEKAAIGIGKSLKVEAEKTSAVINVKYGSVGEPEKAACVLQNLAKLYLEKHLQLRRPVGSSTFFAEQTEKYGRDLAAVESRLANFGKDEGVTAPDLLRAFMAQQITNSETALHQAVEATYADIARLKELKGQLRNTSERIVTQQTSNAAGSLMQQLEESMLAAQVKKTQLLVEFDPSYPLVLEVDKEIAETQAALDKAKQLNYTNQTTDRDPTHDFLRQDMARTQADLATQKANVIAITASLQTMHSQMVELDAKAVKLAALVREDKATESNYLLYLNKREQERTSDALDQRRIADVVIAVPAVVPALPAINPFTAVLLGFIFAIFAAGAAVLIAERIDPSFRTPGEVIETLRIPILASLPKQAA